MATIQAFWRFNPYHDEDGQFTEAPSSSGLGTAAAARLGKASALLAAVVSSHEQTSLEEYTGPLYLHINSKLRDRGYGLGLTATTRSFISGLDTLLKRPEAALPVTASTYRGVSKRSVEVLEEAAAGSGLVWDEGFVSTSISKRVAQQFRAVKGKRTGAVVRIDLPKGTPAAYVPAFSKSYTSTLMSTEKEVLLPRRSVFRVRKEGDVWVLSYVGLDQGVGEA